MDYVILVPCSTLSQSQAARVLVYIAYFTIALKNPGLGESSTHGDGDAKKDGKGDKKDGKTSKKVA